VAGALSSGSASFRRENMRDDKPLSAGRGRRRLRRAIGLMDEGPPYPPHAFLRCELAYEHLSGCLRRHASVGTNRPAGFR